MARLYGVHLALVVHDDKQTLPRYQTLAERDRVPSQNARRWSHLATCQNVVRYSTRDDVAVRISTPWAVPAQHQHATPVVTRLRSPEPVTGLLLPNGQKTRDETLGRGE